MSWKDQALMAYHADIAKREQEDQARRDTKRKKELDSFLADLKKLIGIEVDSETVIFADEFRGPCPYVTVDGVEFSRGSGYGYDGERILQGVGVMYDCKECGHKMRSEKLTGLAELGCALSRENLPYHVCEKPEREDFEPPPIHQKETPVDRLVSALREVIQDQMMIGV